MAAVAAGVWDARAAGIGVLRRLATCQDTTGNLRDPVTGQPLGPSHYAVSLFAGACAASGQDDLQRPAERAVEYVLGLPASLRGAHELNNLGLLASYRAWSGDPGHARLRRPLADYLLRMPFASVTGRTTNNWHAMRAVCLLQRGRALGRPADVEAARRCLHQDVLPLQDTSGLFADYPPGADGGTRCTPLPYHAKFCAMLAMFLADLPDPEAEAALRRGVTALAKLCAPDGESLYFGRSCNSLYGYAAALYAVRWSLAHGVVRGETARQVGAAAARLAEFGGRLVQPDGSFRTYPTPFERERLGWDDYVDRLDYAAFAAFLLVQTPQASPVPEKAERVRWEAPQAGLWVEGHGDRFAAFSTCGQFHPGSYLFTDARYSGLQVLTWKHRDRTVVPPPPHEMSDPTEPRWVGFMPVVEAGGAVWAVRRYQEVRAFPASYGVAFVGRGAPVCLRKTATHQAARQAEGRRWLELVWRGARAAARRLGVRPPGAYREVVLAGGELRRSLVWLPGEGCLVCVDRFDGTAQTVWATVRLSAPPVLCDGVLRFHVRGLTGEVRLLLGAAGPPRVEEGFTSHGLAYTVRYPLRPGVPATTALVVEGGNTTCEAAPGGVRVRVGSCSFLVDLDHLEVRW